jgi:hypothetical protein
MTAHGGTLGWLTAYRGELLFQLLDAIEPAYREQHHRIQRFGRAYQTELERALLASTCPGRSSQRKRSGARLRDFIHGVHRAPSLATNAGHR